MPRVSHQGRRVGNETIGKFNYDKNGVQDNSYNECLAVNVRVNVVMSGVAVFMIKGMVVFEVVGHYYDFM